MKNFFINEYKAIKEDLKKISSILLLLFVISIILMNLFANKSIETNIQYLRLDGGIILSWLIFLVGDIITKTYGAKTSIRISIFSIVINLVVCIFFFIIAKIPGQWGEYYSLGENNDINIAINNTLSNNFLIILGSTFAFFVSSVVNALLNELVGKRVKDNFFGFAFRSYISTMIAQMVDNFIFDILISLNFFGWTVFECFICSLFGAVVELLCEIVFSPVGYYFSRKIKEEEK